jgi:hypothetical protein
MRHVAAVAAAAIAIALVLVLVLGEDEVEEPAPVTATGTTADPPGTDTAPTPPDRPTESRDAAKIERAVALYVEAVERGDRRAEGLPTSDELSIRGVRVEGDRATATLAGGARLALRRAGGRWRVSQVLEGGVARPTPPSNG